MRAARRSAAARFAFSGNDSDFHALSRLISNPGLFGGPPHSLPLRFAKSSNPHAHPGPIRQGPIVRPFALATASAEFNGLRFRSRAIPNAACSGSWRASPRWRMPREGAPQASAAWRPAGRVASPAPPAQKRRALPVPAASARPGPPGCLLFQTPIPKSKT